jgi:predicted alpha/beta-fold hydrolase
MTVSASEVTPPGAQSLLDRPSPSWHTPFVPQRWLRNGHLQTLVGNFLRRDWSLPEAETVLVPAPASPEDAPAREAGYGPTQLLSLCHWQPEPVRRERLTVLLLHGLEGSAHSRYVLGNASRAWAAGCNVVRMNMRSCGGSDRLAPTIYHSGRSEDVAAVVETLVQQYGLEHIALVGYSMGANLVLKYAGEHGSRVRQLRAIVGVSPLMDLATSSAALHEPQNRIYEWRFLRNMKRRLRLKAELFPALYAPLEPEGVYRQIRTMRDFDHQIVARYGGFRDADDYYASVASSRYAASLSVPTLILHSLDDPFIRMLASTRAALAANPHVTYIETQHGGHCAFLTGNSPSDHASRQADRHWAERTLLGYLLHQTREETWP